MFSITAALHFFLSFHMKHKSWSNGANFSPQHSCILMGFLFSQLQTPQVLAQECHSSSVPVTDAGSFPVQQLLQVWAVTCTWHGGSIFLQVQTGTLWLQLQWGRVCLAYLFCVCLIFLSFVWEIYSLLIFLHL